jgi:hypothetical protein
MHHYDTEIRDRRKGPDDISPSYRKPPHKPKRNAECHPDRPHVALGLCRACYRKGRPDRKRAECHPDRPSVARGLCNACLKKADYDQDPETARRQSRESQARARAQRRVELIEAYGGKCACPRCPETNQAFLTLEHVNRDGGAHRIKARSHTYEDLRRQGFPRDGYTLLCWNCNAATRFGRPCPHMTSEG